MVDDFVKFLLAIIIAAGMVAARHMVTLAQADIPVWADTVGVVGLVLVLGYAVIHLWRKLESKERKCDEQVRHKDQLIEDLHNKISDDLREQIERVNKLEDTVKP